MKQTSIFLLILFCVGCENKLQEAQVQQEKATKQKATKQLKEVQKIGEESSMELLKNLKENLEKAMQSKGPEAAIQFCSLEALNLTNTTQNKLKKGIEIKRTSSKYRNPKNAPDEKEKAALAYFEKKLLDKKNSPKFYIQELESSYRYYKPLKVMGLCLVCHGSQENLIKPIQKALAKNYPKDQAVNYKLNDFRGVVRVQIPKTLLNEQ